MKTQRGGYIIIVFVVILNLIAAGWVAYNKINLRNCQREESFNCPQYTCKTNFKTGNGDALCGNRPYRCKNNQPDCQTSSEKICQPTLRDLA